jgi:hypothetical protein
MGPRADLFSTSLCHSLVRQFPGSTTWHCSKGVGISTNNLAVGEKETAGFDHFFMVLGVYFIQLAHTAKKLFR